jgi:hypothetical protein
MSSVRVPVQKKMNSRARTEQHYNECVPRHEVDTMLIDEKQRANHKEDCKCDA